MKRSTKRRLLLGLVLAVLTLNLSCVSFHLPYHGKVVGPAGEPVSGALVFYSFRGDSHNAVCTSSYLREGSLTRTDAEGRFRIGGAMHWRRPWPLQSGTRLEGTVYSTRNHSLATFSDRPETLTVKDHGQDPARWQESAERVLIQLLPAVEGAGSGPARYRDVPLDLRRQAFADLRAEWDLFESRFGDSPFRPGDRRTWRTMIAPSRKWLATLESRVCK